MILYAPNYWSSVEEVTVVSGFKRHNRLQILLLIHSTNFPKMSIFIMSAPTTIKRICAQKWLIKFHLAIIPTPAGKNKMVILLIRKLRLHQHDEIQEF